MKLLKTSDSDNFFYLFGALMVLILVVPLMAAALGPLGALLGSFSFSVALVVALWSMRTSPFLFFAGVGLVTMQILATGVWLSLDSRYAYLIAMLFSLIFFVISTGTAARQVFRRDRVDLNKVVGALCIYLLMGVIWAILLSMLESLVPGSFTGLADHEGAALSWRFVYFSFVTLTTLGYGDVLPVNVYAETLVFTEAIVGQFYLAVLVAGLIGAFLSDREEVPANR